MEQTIIYTTENSNSYLYDNLHQISMLVHPELKKAINASIDIDPYYRRKYLYLKSNGFFSISKLAPVETKIEESIVEESIANTPQILFEVTDFCNLKCTYCALGDIYEIPEVRNSKNIDLNSATKLLRYVFGNKKRTNNNLIISFYGGEPLLNISFIKKIISIANKLNIEQCINIRYNMTTNAVLLYKHIDFLIENNFNLLISLDGDKNNNSYRILKKTNDNSFNEIIRNLDLVKTKYPNYFRDNIEFNAVLHNKNSVKAVYEFIYSKYQKLPKISELNSASIDSNHYQSFKNIFHDVRKSEFEYHEEDGNLIPHNELIAYHEVSNFMKYLSINSYISNVNLLLHSKEKYLPSSTCFPFSKKIFLTTSNTLLPCEKINYKYALGRIEKDVILNTEEVTQRYSLYYKRLKKHCQHCYLYKFCGLCMFHVKKLEIDDTACDFFHDQNAFNSKLNRIFSFLEKYPKDLFNIIEEVIIIS